MMSDLHLEVFCGGIFLHAWSYTIGELNFRAPSPEWASQLDREC